MGFSTPANTPSVQEAKARGVNIITVGITMSVNEKQISDLASSPYYAFFVDNYHDLLYLQDALIGMLCPQEGNSSNYF